ncbi:MAG: energy transducer TonB [Pseudomonadota bacterium]
MTRTKIVSLMISIGLVSLIGLAMVLGLAVSAVQEIAERVTTVDIEEEEEPEEEPEEPPPPEETSPPPPTAVQPPITFNQPDPVETTPEITPPTPPIRQPSRSPTPAPPGPSPTPTPPPPPPPPDLSARATPRNAGRWSAQISNNYPSRALRREIEGTVGVSVTIGTNGRVSGCSVSRSSGSSILDDAACKGMRRYARFNAAKDKAGNPTTGSYSTSITYRLN